MMQGARRVVLAAVMVVTVVVPHFTAQPPSADQSIDKDRSNRQAAVKAGHVAATPKRGFFGTIFHLILEQINDTKSAYTQITDLVNNQFTDDNTVTENKPDEANNGTTETPKISRTEFLRILDRNLKGLARLRDLEWREAKKDSLANLREYRSEIFRGKKTVKRK